MKEATVQIKSASPYSQSKMHSEPKTKGESDAEYGQRTWRSFLHINEDGYIIIPPMAFHSCMHEAAQYKGRKVPDHILKQLPAKATFTKNFKAGIIMPEPMVLSLKAEDAKCDAIFAPKGCNPRTKSRVPKWYPLLHKWEGKLKCYVLDDGITDSVFEYYLQIAGQFIGIGRFRPINGGYYGRYEVKKIKWSG